MSLAMLSNCYSTVHKTVTFRSAVATMIWHGECVFDMLQWQS